MPVRLVIVDDHPVLLKGLAALVGSEPRYSVVATGTTSDEAVAVAAEVNPDVMILDLSMPGDVFAAMQAITSRAPRTKLVIFTAYANVDLALRAFFAGAAAFVVKGQPADELFAAIEAVRAGELFVSPQFSRRLLHGFRNFAKRPPGATAEIEAQERLWLGTVDSRQSVADIADRLGCSRKVAGHYLVFLRRRRRNSGQHAPNPP